MIGWIGSYCGFWEDEKENLDCCRIDFVGGGRADPGGSGGVLGG